MRVIWTLLLASAALPATAWANTCPTAAPQPLQPTAVVPVANELAPLASGQLGAPDGVLARAYDDALNSSAVMFLPFWLMLKRHGVLSNSVRGL